ncbi:WD repeat protein Vps8 [Schizosaccharomyces cryophilus OY26]|uniref:WD repeat protein Vps8 n=1 Tax=Schizosaccharomyces cryophilus (strain OY26 / ATCC MYA-4695 / CBS 11777 / NBRC 106824 / NRRL Y48691) TaxID=653667 RepID=S9W2P2_SCHCR|nr:WD repeat protein Vps8 [Schizosaccharomyces cryophilus OY26]EPY52769.1 WD repeat protein Vps8 [Schizosaccharomyces cryophilus OY26]
MPSNSYELKLNNYSDSNRKLSPSISRSRSSTVSSSVNTESTGAQVESSSHAIVNSSLSKSEDFQWNKFWIRWGRLRRISLQLETSESGQNSPLGTGTCITHSGNLLAVGTSSGCVLLNNLRNNTSNTLVPELSSSERFLMPVTCLAISHTHRVLCQGHGDGTLFVWDLTQNPPVQRHAIRQPFQESVLTHLVFNGLSDNVLLSASASGKVFVHEFYNFLINKHHTAWEYDFPDVQPTFIDRLVVDVSSISFEELYLTSVKHTSFIFLQSLSCLRIISLFPKLSLVYKLRYSDVQANSACHAVSSFVVPTSGSRSRTRAFFCLGYDCHVRVYALTLHQGVLSVELLNKTDFSTPVWKVWYLPNNNVIFALLKDKRILFMNGITLNILGVSSISEYELLTWDWYQSALTMQGISLGVFPYISSSFSLSPRYLFFLTPESVTVGTFISLNDQLQFASEKINIMDTLKLGLCYHANSNLFSKSYNQPDLSHKLMDLLKNYIRILVQSFPSSRSVESSSTDPLVPQDELEQLLQRAENMNPGCYNLVLYCLRAANFLNGLQSLLDYILPCLAETEVSYIFMEALLDMVLQQNFKAPSPDIQKLLLLYLEENRRLAYADKLIPAIEHRYLDLDFSTRFSTYNGLFNSLCYVSIYAFNDYSTPLVKFLKLLVADLNDSSEWIEYCVNNGFQYLLNSLTGFKYPLCEPNSVNEAYTVTHTLLKIIFSVNILPFKISVPESGSFPYLRLFLKKRASSFFECLENAFDSPYFSLDKVTIAKQPVDTVSRQWMIECLSQIFNTTSFQSDSYYTFLANTVAKYSKQILLPQSFYLKIMEGLCNVERYHIDNQGIQKAVENLLSVYDPPNIEALLNCFWDNHFYHAIMTVSFNHSFYDSYFQAILALWDQKDSSSLIFKSSEALITMLFDNLRNLNSTPVCYNKYIKCLISFTMDFLNVDKVTFLRLASSRLKKSLPKMIEKCMSAKSVQLQVLGILYNLSTYEELLKWFGRRRLLSFFEIVCATSGDYAVLKLLQVSPEFKNLEGLINILIYYNCLEASIQMYRELKHYNQALSQVLKYVRTRVFFESINGVKKVVPKNLERVTYYLQIVVPLYQACLSCLPPEEAANLWVHLVFSLIDVYANLSRNCSQSTPDVLMSFEDSVLGCIEGLLNSFLELVQSDKNLLNIVVLKICTKSSESRECNTYMRDLLLKFMTDVHVSCDIYRECASLWDRKQFYDTKSSLSESTVGVLIDEPDKSKEIAMKKERIKVLLSGQVLPTSNE